MIKIDRSKEGYGTTIWLGNRVRLGSYGTMTPMFPRIMRSGDEYCNDVLLFHLWPLVSIEIWWNKRLHTEADGMCENCKFMYREAFGYAPDRS